MWKSNFLWQQSLGGPGSARVDPLIRIWIRIEVKSWIRIRIKTIADPKTARATVKDFYQQSDEEKKKIRKKQGKWGKLEQSREAAQLREYHT